MTAVVMPSPFALLRGERSWHSTQSVNGLGFHIFYRVSSSERSHGPSERGDVVQAVG